MNVMLTIEQFGRTQRLALRLAGIELRERHRELLCRKCRRGQIQSVAHFDALLNAVEEGNPVAWRQLVGLVTTNFTGFFRHPRHFDVAAEHAFRVARQRGRARLWSAAAATGEEPYSLAIALIEAFGRDEPATTILATDIDADAPAIAEAVGYNDRVLQELKPDRRERFFTEAAAGR